MGAALEAPLKEGRTVHYEELSQALNDPQIRSQYPGEDGQVIEAILEAQEETSEETQALAAEHRAKHASVSDGAYYQALFEKMVQVGRRQQVVEVDVSPGFVEDSNLKQAIPARPDPDAQQQPQPQEQQPQQLRQQERPQQQQQQQLQHNTSRNEAQTTILPDKVGSVCETASHEAGPAVVEARKPESSLLAGDEVAAAEGGVAHVDSEASRSSMGEGKVGEVVPKNEGPACCERQ